MMEAWTCPTCKDENDPAWTSCGLCGHEEERVWFCEDCGWPWPLKGAAPVGAECDSCGGTLVAETPIPATPWRQRDEHVVDGRIEEVE